MVEINRLVKKEAFTFEELPAHKMEKIVKSLEGYHLEIKAYPIYDKYYEVVVPALEKAFNITITLSTDEIMGNISVDYSWSCKAENGKWIPTNFGDEEYIDSVLLRMSHDMEREIAEADATDLTKDDCQGNSFIKDFLWIYDDDSHEYSMVRDGYGYFFAGYSM